MPEHHQIAPLNGGKGHHRRAARPLANATIAITGIERR
jgi:hypothetical protein